jgi:hypothetical protein
MTYTLLKMLEDVQKISEDYDYSGGKTSLLQWTYEIVLTEFFTEFYSERVSVYEHRDAKIVYIPKVKYFNVVVYCSDGGASRDISLKFEDALVRTTGCETVEEAKKHLKLSEGEYAAIAIKMYYMITEALEINACEMPIYDV